MAVVLLALWMLACRRADPAKIFEYAGKADTLSVQNELHKGLDFAEIRRICESYEVTPLNVAADGGYVEIAKALIGAGFDVNVKSAKDHVSPLWSAAASGKDEMVSFLIERGADVNAGMDDRRMSTPLDAAASFGHSSTVDLLLKSAPDKDQKRAHALGSAAAAGQLAVVKVLMHDPEARKGIALAAELAVGSHRSEVVKYLEDTDPTARAVVAALRR